MIRRDEFGEKPLYYYTDKDGDILTSDRVLGLLERGVPRKLSRQGLLSYLTYGGVVTPLTMIDGVFMLPAGCELAGGKIVRYWRPDFTPYFSDLREAQAAVTEAVRASIRECVDACGTMPAAFLSGGIDSSAIVAVMRQLYDGEIRTYCVKHDDDKTDESSWAQRVADCNHTKHTVLHLTDELIRSYVLKALSTYDQPTLDGVNFWFASKLVKEAGETVVLSGEGGDELFAGYDRFAKQMLAYRWMARMDACGRHLWGPLFGPMIESLARNEKFRKVGALMSYQYDPYSLSRRIFSPRDIKRLINPDLYEEIGDFQVFVTGGHAPTKSDLINRISWLELQTVTTDLWLRDGYQTSHVHNLQIRTPLLNRSLAELLFSIPGQMKCTPAYPKPLLVRAAGKGLPLECATRRKQGFSLPFDRYFSGDIKDLMDDFLDGRDLRLFNPVAIRRLGQAYRAGQVYWNRIWALFVVEYWCKQNGVTI